MKNRDGKPRVLINKALIGEVESIKAALGVINEAPTVNAETDTQFTIFDLSALKKQCLIFHAVESPESVVAQPPGGSFTFWRPL